MRILPTLTTSPEISSGLIVYEKRIEEYVMNEVEKLPECEGYY